MSVLSDKDIKQLASSGTFIEHYIESSVEGASYDMRLGSQFQKAGVVHTLTKENPTLKLEAGEFAILTSLEVLNMPTWLVGHNGIMSPWAKKGLVSLFSPQIDPGFNGFLKVPVFNAGDQAICINLSEKIFTIEFIQTKSEASYRWSDRHGPQLTMDSLSTVAATRPNLADFKSAIDKMDAELDLLKSTNTAVSAELKVLTAHVDSMKGSRTARMALFGVIFTIIATLASLVASDGLRAASKATIKHWVDTW